MTSKTRSKTLEVVGGTGVKNNCLMRKGINLAHWASTAAKGGQRDVHLGESMFENGARRIGDPQGKKKRKRFPSGGLHNRRYGGRGITACNLDH